MFDILSNHKIAYFQQSSADSSGAAANAPNDDGIDLWASGQLPNALLLMIDVGAVAAGGTLDLIVQDSSDRITWDEDFITIGEINESGLYLCPIYDMNRYIRLNVTVGTNTVTWSGLFMTFEDQRRPVTQIGTIATHTYGTGRTAKVALV